MSPSVAERLAENAQICDARAALTALIARGAFGLTTGARMLDGMSAAVAKQSAKTCRIRDTRAVVAP